MKPEILIALVRAAEQGLSKRQASESSDIPYQTVLKYSKDYGLKFACERRRVNEKRREERIERERGGRAQTLEELSALLQIVERQLIEN